MLSRLLQAYAAVLICSVAYFFISSTKKHNIMYFFLVINVTFGIINILWSVEDQNNFSRRGYARSIILRQSG